MRHLFHIIRSTLYDPAFYAIVRKEPLGTGIRWNAILGFIGVGLIAALLYGATLPSAFSPFVDSVVASYPDDLIVVVAGGEVSINQPQPYYIKNTLFKDGPENLIIFDGEDTLKGGTKEHSTLVIVKKTHLITGEENSERATHFDPKAATTTVTKADVARIAEAVRPYFKPLVILGGLFVSMLFVVFGGGTWLLFHLIYLALPGLLMYLYGRFRSPQMEFKESYVVALYASIPVAILTFIAARFDLHWPVFIYTLFVMLVALVNLTQIANRVPEEFSREN